MSSFVKCELCNVEISGERCIFATYRVEVVGKEYYFCCEQHANDFKRKYQKPENATKKRRK